MTDERGVIALLTDFGAKDSYVGVIKAVIADRCHAAVIDLTHAIAPQNVRQAAFVLWTAYRFLPRGSVTMCVVDPGVGTSRTPIAVAWPGGYFVGPDNGWLTYPLRDASGASHMEAGRVSLPSEWMAVTIRNPEFQLSKVSQTFHGRDIFAPASAALASGTPIDLLGPKFDSLASLPLGGVVAAHGTITGEVIHVDHFGNLITSIESSILPERFRVFFGSMSATGPARSYQEAGDLIAIVGSNDLLEIAAPNASAEARTGLGVGARVTVAALAGPLAS